MFSKINKKKREDSVLNYCNVPIFTHAITIAIAQT